MWLTGVQIFMTTDDSCLKATDDDGATGYSQDSKS